MSVSKCFLQAAFLTALLTASPDLFAQSGYVLKRSTVAAGGALTMFSTNNFTLAGTVGQAVAGYARDNSTNTPAPRELETGFWIHDTPEYYGIFSSTNDFNFRFDTWLGSTYVVEYTDSLSNANWQPLQTFLGDGTVKNATNTVTTGSQRYYRLREP